MLRLVSTYTVELDIPKHIHPVFYIKLVRYIATDPLPSQVTRNEYPEPELVGDRGEDSEIE